MPGTPTTRLALPTIAGGTDSVSSYPSVNLSQMTTLDNAVTFSEGTLVARPAAALAGRTYFATDTGLFYLDTGTAWQTLPVLGGLYGPLAWTTVGVNTTAVAGNFYGATASLTVTLPTPTLNARIGVYNTSASTASVTVTASSGVIGGLGIGVSGATSFSLGALGSFAVLLADGTNWRIVSGQQDPGWVPLSSFGSGVSAGTPAPAYRLRGDRIDLRGIAVCSTAPGNIVQIPTAIMPVATSPVNRFLPTVYSNSWATVALLPGSPNWLAAGAGASIGSAASFNLEGITWPIG